MNCLKEEKRDWLEYQMNLLNVEKRDWQTNVHTKKKNIGNATIADEITKFFAVPRGPLYICSCCNQLWYKQGYHC